LALNVKMFIQGYYIGGGLMNSVMSNQGTSVDPNEVELLTVELHDATTFALVDTASAMLQTDGTLSATFNTAAAGDYYIAVKGRNILETWSAEAHSVAGTPSTYDFTTAEAQSYTDGSQPSVLELEPGVWGVYSGDINQDGGIDLSDVGSISNDSDESAFGDLATDLNGDGGLDLSDVGVVSNNSDLSVYSQHP